MAINYEQELYIEKLEKMDLDEANSNAISKLFKDIDSLKQTIKSIVNRIDNSSGNKLLGDVYETVYDLNKKLSKNY